MRGSQPKPRPTPFARWLTEERRSRELTMLQLAERAGVSDSRIAQLETGQPPSRDMITRLVNGLAAEGANKERLLSAGMVAAGFGPSHELDSLPGEIRAVLVAHLDTLTALDTDSLRLVCEALEAVVRLAKR